VDSAAKFSPRVAYKLIAYTFGSLLHLFLMVLILGHRRIGRLERLLFWLMAALFMWNSGNLLALNVGLFYAVGPSILEAIARLIPFLALALIPPLTIAVHSGYALRFRPPALFHRLPPSLSADFAPSDRDTARCRQEKERAPVEECFGRRHRDG